MTSTTATDRVPVEVIEHLLSPELGVQISAVQHQTCHKNGSATHSVRKTVQIDIAGHLVWAQRPIAANAADLGRKTTGSAAGNQSSVANGKLVAKVVLAAPMEASKKLRADMGRRGSQECSSCW